MNLSKDNISVLARLIGGPCSNCTNYTNAHSSLMNTREEIEMSSLIFKSMKCEKCHRYNNFSPTDAIINAINNYIELKGE